VAVVYVLPGEKDHYRHNSLPFLFVFFPEELGATLGSFWRRFTNVSLDSWRRFVFRECPWPSLSETVAKRQILT